MEGGRLYYVRLNYLFFENKYKELSQKIIDPEVMKDIEEWQKLVKEHADMEPIVFKYREYTKTQELLEEDRRNVKGKTR